MTLYFLQNNVHFNFKTENDILNIESKCVQMKIKGSTILNNDRSIQYDGNLSFALFFDFYLLLIVVLSLILMVKTKGEKYSIYI
jgi:hypothetical protein